MGFVKSLQRRAALARGEGPLDAVRIFFASKQQRRDLEVAKFGELRRPDFAVAASVPLAPGTAEPPYLDAEWYAKTHALPGRAAAIKHYNKNGMAHFLAPCRKMAGSDGMTLAQWASEYLVRTGVALGAPGKSALSPEDDGAIRPFAIRNRGRKRLAVVTAIFGGFDRLLPVEAAWREHTDFFLFSDRRFEATSAWQPVHGNYFNADPRRSARFVKLHLPTYFSDYEWVIWVDGSVLFCVDPIEILARIEHDDVDFATFRHPDRQGLIAEAAACWRFKKEEPMMLIDHLHQAHRHPSFRTPELYETMVMALKPGSGDVRALCTTWWRMMMRGSKRDQLSLPLAVAETPGLRVGHLPDDMTRSTLFARSTHQKRA
ncbi:MAG: glycosyltransferase domain-containing protein [Pseudomonadota bacterium]